MKPARSWGAALLLGSALVAAAGCGREFAVEVTVLRGGLAVPPSVEIAVTLLDDAGATLDERTVDTPGADFFSDEGVTNRVLVRPGPGASAVRVVATVRDDGGAPLASASIDVPRAPGLVSVTLTLGAGSDAGAADGGGLDGGLPSSPACQGTPDRIIVVNDASDTDDNAEPWSLREAIGTANQSPGATEIHFDPIVFPAGGAVTIPAGDLAGEPLPAIMRPDVCIDGAGASVVIDGAAVTVAPMVGLRLNGANGVVANLSFTSFGAHAVHLGPAATGARVLGCAIANSGGRGIIVEGTVGARIGGSTSEEGNSVFSNGGHGIHLTAGASLATVSFNRVGSDPLFSAPFGNLGHGIRVDGGSQDNVIGPANTVGYSGMLGISVDGATTLRNRLTENAISENATAAIFLSDFANANLLPPLVADCASPGAAGTAAGAPPGSVVELFVDPLDEAACFLGATTTDAATAWSFAIEAVTVPPGCGTYLTATVTDPDGNTSPVSGPCLMP